MRIALFILLPFAATAVAQTPKLAKPCKPEALLAGKREPARVRPLSEMPPAKHILGVYREANGCAEPIVLRERVGASPR